MHPELGQVQIYRHANWRIGLRGFCLLTSSSDITPVNIWTKLFAPNVATRFSFDVDRERFTCPAITPRNLPELPHSRTASGGEIFYQIFISRRLPRKLF